MIYLDYNATTPVDPEVIEVMTASMRTDFANPSSKHAPGERARMQVERARKKVAALAGTSARSIVFTSGATESAAIAFHGLAASPGRPRVLVAATEHNAVLDAARSSGAQVDTIPVRTDGLIDLDYLHQLLSDDVAVVAVMAANNETGVLNDVAAIAAAAHTVGAVFVCDVTQMLGKLPVTLDEWGVDVAFASAHKLYGPKGVGMLSLTAPVRNRLRPLIGGGGQERGLRGGTVNTTGIVGFGHAAELAAQRMDDDRVHLARLRDLLYFELHMRTDFAWYGRRAPRVPNTLYLRFPGAPADAVLSSLTGVAISSGSACSSTDSKPSHVLTAMGVEPGPALQALRFSIGRTTTEDEIRRAATEVAAAVTRVRALSVSADSRRISA